MYKIQLQTQSFTVADNKAAIRAYNELKQQGIPVKLFRWVPKKNTKRIKQPGYYVEVK